MGVPVITVDRAVVVGFDQPRLEQLLAGSMQRFRLGAAVAPVSSGGVLVGQVHSGSVAARTGLRAGDVILAVGEQAVKDADQLRALLELSVNAHLRVRRDGSTLQLAVATD